MYLKHPVSIKEMLCETIQHTSLLKSRITSIGPDFLFLCNMSHKRGCLETQFCFKFILTFFQKSNGLQVVMKNLVVNLETHFFGYGYQCKNLTTFGALLGEISCPCILIGSSWP